MIWRRIGTHQQRRTSHRSLTTDVLVDRLTVNGTIIETGTDSYRLATTRARAEEQTAAG